MQLIVVLFKTVFLAAFLGTALCDKVGDGSGTKTKEGSEVLVCPEEFSNHKIPVTERLSYIQHECFGRLETNSSKQVLDTGTLEELQTYFRGFCQQQSKIHDCLAEKSLIIEVCPSQALKKSFGVARDVVMNFMDAVCDDHGLQMSTLMHGMNLVQKQNKQLIQDIKKCVDEFANILKLVEQTTADLPSKFFIIHHEIIRVKECMSKSQLDKALKKIWIDIFDRIISTMKCIHPEGGELVPCAMISPDLFGATSVCEAVIHNSNLSVYDVVEKDSARCYAFFLRYDLHNPDVCTDNAALREAVGVDCSLQWAMKNCWKKEKSVATICLNQTENIRFARRNDFFANAMEAACSDEGQSLATVLFEVYRLKRTGQGHAVLDCIEVAKSSTTASLQQPHSDATSRPLRFYREVETFKECLLAKLGGGDRASLDAASSLINDMLKKMECVHPEDGTTVLCSTLVAHA